MSPDFRSDGQDVTRAAPSCKTQIAMPGPTARVGNYRVLRKLGEGGMGVVYEAVHEHIGRRAAIKVLHPEFSANQQMAARFFNEARAVNIIQHSGVVGIFEFGHCADRSAYLVMEYLEGESLAAHLARHRRDPSPHPGEWIATTLRIGRQIAVTLAITHGRGIVHRDLKPENVMLVPEPEVPGGLRAKLLDFGIAKLHDDPDHPVLSGLARTGTGILIGTPAYMSPEQCRGAGTVDARSDVYALGVMLFEMLAGRTPFLTEGAGEMIGLQLFGQPPALCELNPALPQRVCSLVDQMLAKNPAERPTMQELAVRFQSLLEEEAAAPIAAVPASVASAVPIRSASASPAHPRGARSRPLLVLVLTALALLAAIGAAWRSTRHPLAPAQAFSGPAPAQKTPPAPASAPDPMPEAGPRPSPQPIADPPGEQTPVAARDRLPSAESIDGAPIAAPRRVRRPRPAVQQIPSQTTTNTRPRDEDIKFFAD